MAEIWKDVEAYKKFYQVSSEGRLKSLSRFAKNGKVGGFILPERMIKPSYANGKDYGIVTLHKEGNKKVTRIHQIVCKAFHKKPAEHFEVNHINGIKTDNRAENLEWVEHKTNMIHAFKTLKCRRSCGETKAHSRLRDEDVLYIRKHYIFNDNEFGDSALAKKFGVTSSTVWHVTHNKTWKHLLPKVAYEPTA